jgi:TonB family protein
MRRTCLAIASVFVVAAGHHPKAQNDTIAFSEMIARASAVRTSLPAYPRESAAGRVSGVAVASFATDATGRVTSVTILEAPDAAIGAAVETAVREWTFKPTQVSGRDEQYGLRSKLTFYFRLANGRGSVANPQDLPGGPKLPSGPPPSAAPGVRGGVLPPPPGGRPATVGGRPTVVNHADDPSVEIGTEGLGRLERPMMLDIRERAEFARGRQDGAVNIPRDEVVTRAGIELDRARPIVIDCSRLETRRCHDAARVLRANGFGRVFVYLP